MTIRTAKYIRNKLKIKPINESMQNNWHFLYGVYQSRIFGLCIYRQP